MRPRARRPREQRGAVTVVVALLMGLIVLAASFTVDLGMQRVLRSDLQALADVAALDAARLLDGRTAAEVRSGDAHHPSMAAVVAASLAANSTTVGEPPTLTATLVETAADELGALVAARTADGTLVPVAADDVPDAVLVTAAGEVDFVFSALRGGASRTSVANASTFACFRLGSFAAALSTGDSAVAGVFEAMVQDALGINLTAVGYQGLLTSSVAVGDLATELGVGTLDELAALDDLSLGTLFTAYATVLGRDGRSAAQATVLQLAQRVTSGLGVDVGDLLSTGDGSALAGRLNAVDLLGSAALGVAAVLSDGNNVLSTGVAWSAPHVSSGSIELRAIEAPQQACGPVGTTASTAQASLVADLDFALPNKITLPGGLGSLDVGVPADPDDKRGTLHLDASLAGATGTLVGATCGAGTAADPQGIAVDVDTRLLTTNVSLPFRVTGSITTAGSSTVLPPGLLGSVVDTLFGVVGSIAEVRVDLDLRATARASLSVAPHAATSPTAYLVPPRDYTDVEPSDTSGGPVAIPTPQVSLDLAGSTASVTVTVRTLGLLTSTRTATVPVAALDLGPVLQAATGSVIGSSTASVVANVNQALTPVSSLLGIRTAGADLIGVAPPVCGHPRLVG